MDAVAPDRHRIVTWNDPAETAAHARALPGLEYLHRLTSGQIPAAPVAQLVGLRSTYVLPGRVVFAYEPREEHYNALGAVDAGILTTVLDAAMAAAVQSLLAAELGLATVELRTSFVRPVTLASGPLRAEGVVVHSGSRLATAEAKLVDASGRLHANASSTALVLPHEHKLPLAA